MSWVFFGSLMLAIPIYSSSRMLHTSKPQSPRGSDGIRCHLRLASLFCKQDFPSTQGSPRHHLFVEVTFDQRVCLLFTPTLASTLITTMYRNLTRSPRWRKYCLETTVHPLQKREGSGHISHVPWQYPEMFRP